MKPTPTGISAQKVTRGLYRQNMSRRNNYQGIVSSITGKAAEHYVNCLENWGLEIENKNKNIIRSDL